MGEWHWRSDKPTSGARGSAASRRLGTEHPTQGEAESWLGETYPDLLASGITAVSLYEGDRLVYGPMNLEAEPG